MRQKIKLKFLPLIILVMTALWSIWPSVISIKNSLPDDYDGLLITWIINQNIQKIPDNLGNIFQGNIFYPNKNTIAFSDLYLPSSLIAYIPVKISGYPIVAFNFNFVLAQVLTMIVVYLWWKEMTKNSWAAFVASVALGLSQIRFHYLAHLQMWTMQWWLISAWMIWRFARSTKVINLYLAGLFLIIQVWESILPVYWIVLIGLILFAQNKSIFLKNLKHTILVFVTVILLSLPVVNIYLNVTSKHNFKRTIRDAAHFSMGIEEPFTKFISPGLYILSGLSFFFINKKSLKKDKNTIFLLTIVIICMIMSLGPVVKVNGNTLKLFGKLPIPLPYALAYYLIPGLKALRTTSRWIWPVAWAISGIIALGLSRFKQTKKLIIFVFSLLIAVIFGTRLTKVINILTPFDYPKIYQWLSIRNEQAILELPIYTWADKNGINEVHRMLYSLEHKKNLVNGYSGFFPPEWELFVVKVNSNFPNQVSEQLIKQRNIDLIIIHLDEFQEEKLQEISIWGEKKKIYQDEKSVVFKI